MEVRVSQDTGKPGENRLNMTDIEENSKGNEFRSIHGGEGERSESVNILTTCWVIKPWSSAVA